MTLPALGALPGAFLDLPGGGRIDLAAPSALAGDDVVIVVETEEEDGEEQHLVLLGRELCGQYVELMAAFASAVFRAQEVEARLAELEPALDALTRLAEATPDPELLALLAELRHIAGACTYTGVGARTLLLARLRRWVGRAADLLGDERGAQLRRLVELDPATAPLLAHLATVKGIGPRRQERLYAAGLHALDRLIGADPAEVAAVTGLPHGVAVAVVEAAGRYKVERPARVRAELTACVAEIHALLALLDGHDEGHAELREAARAAIAGLEGALTRHREEVR